jgi:hypothetical protein
MRFEEMVKVECDDEILGNGSRWAAVALLDHAQVTRTFPREISRGKASGFIAPATFSGGLLAARFTPARPEHLTRTIRYAILGEDDLADLKDLALGGHM